MIEDNTQRLGDRLEEMDKQILEWAKQARSHLKGELLRLGLHDKVKLYRAIKRKNKERKAQGQQTGPYEPLVPSIKHRLKKRHGEIESANFSFPRHGIFLEHGVGMNRPVGSAKAAAAKQPWLSVIMPLSIEKLADILVENYADLAAEELRFLIPGIMDTKISTR